MGESEGQWWNGPDVPCASLNIPLWAQGNDWDALPLQFSPDPDERYPDENP